ncbi:MAG: hypothetical protein K8R02_06230 [Anaerohalosphaeraceae bacterium]|nr:hypothetical protein [Anaerohalosphaeraceae bacterium]
MVKRTAIKSVIIIVFFLFAVAADAALYEGFEDTAGLSVSMDVDANAVMTVDANDKTNGLASVKLTFTVPSGQSEYETAYIVKKLTGPVDMTGLNMSFSVCPVDRSVINSVYLYLYDASGNVEYWRWWTGTSTGVWTRFGVVEGQPSGADGHVKDAGFNPRYVTSIRFRLRSDDSIGGQTVEAKFDDFRAIPDIMTKSAYLFVEDSLAGITSTAEQIGVTQKLGTSLPSATIMHTNFEEDSAGPNTWDVSISNLWDERDIVTSMNWSPPVATAVIQTSGAREGSQCGKVQGTSGGEGYALLDFGSGENRGRYKMTWYAKYDTDGSGIRNHRTYTTNDAGHCAAYIKMKPSEGITCNDGVMVVTLLGSFSDNVWYEFELVPDFVNKTFDVKVKQAGNTEWATEETNLAFESDLCGSFDQIKCRFWKNLDAGYWDDIKVDIVEEDRIIISVGRYDDPNIVPLIADANLTVDVNWLGQQGFYIKSFGDNKILVTAATEVGVLYGMIELWDRVSGEGYGVLEETLDVADRPVLSIRQGKTYKRANFATAWYTDRESPVFRYDDNPEVFNDVNETFKQDYLQTVESNRNGLKSKVASAADYGAKLYIPTYQPSLPEWATDAFNAHNGTTPARQTEYWHPSVCPSKQASKDLLYDKIKNLFTDVNDIGGIALNIGELDQSIYSCGCSTCGSQSYKNRLIEYVLLIRKAMLDATGYDPNYTYPDDPDAPKVYLRPWGIISHGLGSESEFRSLATILPDDVRFWSKLVPIGDDYTWHDYFTSLIDMPRLETFGWHVYHPNLNQPCIVQLCYTAPKLKARVMKLVNDYGVNGQGQCDGIDSTEPLYEPSRLASSKIAWDPCGFDSNDFLLEWATNRFGEDANSYVANALEDTYKITDAFLTIDPLHTGWYEMTSFVKDKSLIFYNRACVLSQSSSMKNVSEGTLATVLSQFDISDEISIAVDANQNFATAVSLEPNDADLGRFWTMAKATVALTKFYKNYHYAVIYNNLHHNTGNSAYHDTAVSYINLAKPESEDYVDLMNQLHPRFNEFFKEFDTEWNYGYTGLSSKYYHFGQMVGVEQQCKTGYSQLVMEPNRAQNYPGLLWQVENPDGKIGYERYGPFEEEDLWPYTFETLNNKYTSDIYTVNANASESLPQVISPWTQPTTLCVQFTGDLSQGGMLVVKFVPLGCKARYAFDGGLMLRKSVQKVSLNEIYVKTLVDITTDGAMVDDEFVRYIELPPTGTGTQQHELKVLAQDETDPNCIGVGTEFYYMKLYVPMEQSESDMVNTTFEEGSAGAGTWDTSIDYGWDEKDIASGINWVQSGSDSEAGFGSYGGVAYSGSQCGRVFSSATGAKSATLDIASGDNTGIYTMHWYAMQTMHGSGTHVYKNSRVRIREDAGSGTEAAQISMYNDKATGTDTYGICYADNGGQFNKLMDMDYGTWYEFELVLRYGDQEFDFKVREAGTATWTSVTNKNFYKQSDSLDQISCITDKGAASYGYWDNIKVVPVCGGLGYPTGDIDKDCCVDMNDLAIFVSHWLDTSCASPGWCDGSDLDESTNVDFEDLATMANYWLEDRQN